MLLLTNLRQVLSKQEENMPARYQYHSHSKLIPKYIYLGINPLPFTGLISLLIRILITTETCFQIMKHTWNTCVCLCVSLYMCQW